MNIQVRNQKRQSLAFKLTPAGVVVLIPDNVDAQSQQVQDFISEALVGLPKSQNRSDRLQVDEMRQMVAEWQQRLGVKVARLQIRTMRNKWGSVSTAGTLTLAEELLDLPRELVEYVVVHELLHLKFPDHRKGWQVSMSMYLPLWRDLETQLAGYVVSSKEMC